MNFLKTSVRRSPLTWQDSKNSKIRKHKKKSILIDRY